MNRKRLSACVALILVASCAAESSGADELSLGQVAKAAKTYLRDTAEFPLWMKVEVTATDSSGHVRSHKKGRVDYDFHGYNQTAGHAAFKLRGPDPVIRAAFAAASASMMVSNVLSLKAEDNFTFSSLESGLPDVVTGRLTPIAKCQPLEWYSDASGPKIFCGSSEYQLEKQELTLRHFSFDAHGLPAVGDIEPLGLATIARYHVDIDFQKVFLAEDPKPFLVPKLITVTVETDKGKLVIVSDCSSKN